MGIRVHSGLAADSRSMWRLGCLFHACDQHPLGWGQFLKVKAGALHRGGQSEAWKHFLHRSKYHFRLGQRWSGAYGVAHHIPVCLHKGFICLPVPGHLACSFVPSFRVIEIWSPIPKQCHLVLKCWIKSVSELDDDSLVIIIFHKVNELLEVVNIVINQILGLISAGSF